jgi:hypothetical protein
MQEFAKIDTFRGVAKMVREYCLLKNMDLPTVKFNGRVKLCGTQVGIRYTRDLKAGVFALYAQSKRRELSVANDNFGFASWVKRNGAELHRFFDSIVGDGDITIFGEWVGDTVQFGVSLQMAPKHFVMYAAYDHKQDCYLRINWHGGFGLKKTEEAINKYNNMGLYFIQQIPQYSVDVDFANPDEAIARMQDITEKVAEDCPWGRNIWGLNGPGGGIVWYNFHVPTATQFWFKTETMRDQGEELEKMILTEDILPLSVMEIGLKELEADGIDLTESKNIGHFIKWCAKKAKSKEHMVESYGFDWRSISSHVVARARRHYQSQVA